MNTPGKAQHFLECGIRDCERNCQYYCNPCHLELCEQCRNEHLKSPENGNHELVLYQQRKQQLPLEKCKIHTNKDIDLLCEECQVPLCSKCTTLGDHRGHMFLDLEAIYAGKFAQCTEEISKIQEYFLPTVQELKKEIIKDAVEIMKVIDKIRTSMKSDASESLKSLVDEVQSENMKQLDQIENSLKKDLKSQEMTFNDYIIYLEDLVKKFNGHLSSTKSQKLISLTSERMKTQPIPETTKPVTPVFIREQCSKNEVIKLLGRINVPLVKREDDQSGRLWVSDKVGNLVQTDRRGNEILRIKASSYGYGFHTVTQEGDLIFTEGHKKVISRITLDNKITEFIKTGDWEPICIHSSRTNGDLLVGMKKDDKEGKVTRYNKSGKELQNLHCQRDKTRLRPYNCKNYPIYITENINGDICTSEINSSKSTGKRSVVVVVNKSGEHRFSYKGEGMRFIEYEFEEICTDALGHILVSCMDNVLVLNQDGQFLSQLFHPRLFSNALIKSLCVDDESNLYVGKSEFSTVTVYEYLESSSKN
ncbi:E3 ubiquitin-protein ligase TRIM36-like [Saccostrea echinata]|uniref:E3 ubiquitin-protein ligase TRIM36-like n=1 Tax=Saccostrea echinata TaxID=191078 RepID=UPI002A7FC108|nr:E3 ubiquitin-protein ligase TRIM36-like [Saccostrea echinata]